MRTLSLTLLSLAAIACGGSDSSSSPAATADTGTTPAADTGAATPDTAAPPAAPTYEGAVQPIFKKYCAPCHDSGASGGQSIAKSYADSQKDANACAGLKIGACALQRIKNGEMPKGAGCDADPTQAACPQAADIATIQAWVDGGMKEK